MILEKIDKYKNGSSNRIPLLVFDKDQELLEELNSLDEDIYKIYFYQGNPLEVRLGYEQNFRDFTIIIHFPFDEPSTQNEYLKFPLLDLLIAGKVMRLDDVSDLMEDLNWRIQHKNLVEKYKHELKYKYVSDIVKKLDRDRLTESSVQRALFSAWLGASKLMRDEWIIGKILVKPFLNQDEFNTFTNKISKYYLQEILKEIVSNYFSKVPDGFSIGSIENLLGIMKYNCILLNHPEISDNDPYSKIKITNFTKAEKLNNLREYLFNDPDFSDDFPTILINNSEKVKDEVIFREYGLKTSYYYKTPLLIWQILAEISTYWAKNPEFVLKEIPELKKDIKVGSTLDLASVYVYYAASVISDIADIRNLILDKPEDYIHNYTEKWYKIDRNFRQAIHYFTKLNLESAYEKIDFFSINEQLNKTYNKFLEQLNKEWLKCWSSKKFSLDSSKVNYQSGFYQRELENRDVKIAVIISDGLRYEAGIELLNNLHKDSRNVAEMNWQLTSLPSITSVGMANLLPGNERKFDLENVLIDGEGTKTTEQRKTILQKRIPESNAHLFKDVVNLSQKQGREIFSSPLVYIYHNRIDEQGDKSKTEQNTCEAVERSVEELSKFIKKLHSSYYVNRVIITADHGFLYTYDVPQEKDLEKVNLENIYSKDSRFLLVKSGNQEPLGYKIPLEKVSPFNDKLDVIIPEGINRYRIQGAGKLYVHGGASLQEMIIPVIESLRKRKEVSSKVDILMPAENLRIVSNVLRVNIFQKNPVTALDKERKIKAGIYKNNDLVSDEKQLTLNSVSENITERQHEIMLNLKPGMAAGGLMTLKVYDVEDDLNPVLELKVMNQSSIEPDF